MWCATRRRGTTDEDALDRGFTLVEVVVAAVLLALVVLLALPALVTGLRAVVVDRDLARSTALAEQEVELARARPCDAVRAAGTPLGPVDTDSWKVVPEMVGPCVTGSALTYTVTVSSRAHPSRTTTVSTVVYVEVGDDATTSSG